MMNKQEMLKQIEEMKRYVELMPDHPEVERRKFSDWTVKSSIDVQIFARKEMREQGISNKELAEKLNVSLPRVSQIFSEKTELNIFSINKLLKVFNAELVIRRKESEGQIEF